MTLQTRTVLYVDYPLKCVSMHFPKTMERGHRNPLSIVNVRWSVAGVLHVSSSHRDPSCNKGTEMMQSEFFLGVAGGERRSDQTQPKEPKAQRRTYS